MSRINDIHEQAMNLADEAFIAQHKGNHDLAQTLSLQAYELEATAATLLKDDLSAEPTRSVLYRSAASLAVDCGKLVEAEHLVQTGLAGRPPQEIADELHDLLQHIRSALRLAPREVDQQCADSRTNAAETVALDIQSEELIVPDLVFPSPSSVLLNEHSIRRIPLDLLVQHCAEETDKFNRRQPNDPQFCFELLRRGLAEGSSDAFARVYEIYERQVLAWVYSHSRFAQTGESAHFFAGSALRMFYFALRGAKFEQFPSLPKVLSYLKLCVHTAIGQYIRDQQPTTTASLNEATKIAHAPAPGVRLDINELWTYICPVLTDPNDRILARCVFIQDLKPRQIVQQYASQWSSEREVSVAIYRIRRVLQADEQVRVYIQLDKPS